VAKTAPVGWEPVEIGRRARVIRRHRGLSLDGVAVIAGMSEDHLAMLESGERRFERRGQIEDPTNRRVHTVTADQTITDLLAAIGEHRPHPLVNSGGADREHAAVRDAADRERASLLLMTYRRDRMGEARKWLRDGPSAHGRISLWMFNEDTEQLEFFFSNEIDGVGTVEAVFHRGEGLMGQAFLERRRWNEADARQIPGFTSIRPSGTESYDAIMCVPVMNNLDSAPLGMLNFDKRGDKFSGTAESIAVALAAQCAFAFDQYGKAPAA